MHMHIRRMNDRKHHKRSKRGSSKESSKNHVSFPEIKPNGSASAKQLSQGTITPYSYRNIIRKHSHSLNKYRRLELDYINEILNEVHEDEEKVATGNPVDDWDDGLTFTAKYSLGEKSENVPIPGVEDSSTKRLSRDSESESNRVTTPTANEDLQLPLPWKRDDEDDDNGGALKQNEFPAWASNKEYLAYNSPSATFLGGLSKPRPVNSVIGLFRRESSGSGSYDAGSDPTLAGQLSVEMGTPSSSVSRTPVSRPDRRSASICGVAPIAETSECEQSAALLFDSTSGHTGPFPVTASHRRNNRRGSLLEASGDTIPEEMYSKSLPQREKEIANGGTAPLLPKLTPRLQYRRYQTPHTVSLLSLSSTDDSDDDDDNNGDANGYDDRVDI